MPVVAIVIPVPATAPFLAGTGADFGVGSGGLSLLGSSSVIIRIVKTAFVLEDNIVWGAVTLCCHKNSNVNEG